MTNDRLLIYTMAIGAAYDLCPVTPEDGVDYVCLTDRDDIEPNGWELRKVSLLLPADPFRSSREFKICAHRIFGDYSCSIYIDSSVELLASPSEIWSELVNNESVLFGGFAHSYRRRLIGEFGAVEKRRLDYSTVLTEQILHYRQSSPEILRSRPIWGGFLARRHMRPECQKAMEVWFAHVLRYSRRDQLSLPIALANLKASQKNIVQENIKMSPWHRWPIKVLPKPHYQTVR